MKELIMTTILLGNLTITSYQPKKSQTDSSPWTTSIGERVHPHGVAVSRDLLKRWGGPLNYGDWIYIDGYGFKIVNDCMSDTKWDKVNKKRIPIVKAVDIWVPNHEAESKIGVKKRAVYKVKGKLS